MKLISMTDFVIHESFGCGNSIISKEVFYDKCSNYAQFLKQPLNLGMFVATDLEGNVFDEPKNYVLWCKYGDYTQYGKTLTEQCVRYNQAKKRVLFEGFRIENCTITNDIVWIGEGLTLYNTIEDLLIDFEGDITLTKSAQKQLGL